MPHKILVVDDDRINVALVKFALTQRGYSVSFAHDGTEAAEKLQSETPDLIILDVVMPQMNGFEFMAELKQKQGFTTTPVIMLTSNETMGEIFRLEGVKGYFIKPVMFEELLRKIEEVLGPNP